MHEPPLELGVSPQPEAEPPRTALADLPELDEIVVRLLGEGGFGLAQIAHLLGVERWVVGRSLLRAMRKDTPFPQSLSLELTDHPEGWARDRRASGGCSLVGRRLARYEVRELIGCGGMGVVYRAFDQARRREVALKVLPAARGTDFRWRLRFRQEARTASFLEHPHICATHEIDEADGLLFISMELIRGERLLDRLRRWDPVHRRYEPSPLPLRQALDVGIEIAQALGRVHDEGIVHLDLKPSNVMVTASGHAKLIDFGLSRSLEPGPALQGDGVSSHGRQVGRVCGTLSYMSPEQAAGWPVDQRSDIFSFGVLLHEMLTGTNPLRRPGGAGRGGRTSTRLVGETVVISGLQYVLDRCLARAPGDRYAAIERVIDDLTEVKAWVDSRGSSLESSPTPPALPDEDVMRWSGGPAVACVPSGPTRPEAACPSLCLLAGLSEAPAPASWN